MVNLKPNNQKGKPMSSNKIRTLVATDRCDKCNARARIALRFKTGELMFCGHCFGEMSDSLKLSDPLIVGADDSLMVVMK